MVVPRPRLGVLAHGPIQYHAPLYQLLASRRNVELDVLYLADRGHHPLVDPGFGVPVAWDIDLLSGYRHRFLTTTERPVSTGRQMSTLLRWLPSHDTVVINGYTSPWMLLAMTVCRSRHIPYLLRGSSHPQSQSTGIRRQLRNAGTRLVVSGSAAGLAMGMLNQEFYEKNGARLITFAPNSVDMQRFACPPLIGRSELLARWGLSNGRPVVIFCGKLVSHKRPLDLVTAIGRLPAEVNTLFVGDGALAESVRASLEPSSGVVTGFVNQSELPAYYHAADILVLPSESEPWGLVVNEAMAAGVLPVVSDRVGAAPDLVRGLGEIYPCGDIASLASALSRALAAAARPGTRDRVRRQVARYSLDRTAAGFEQAAVAVAGLRDPVVRAASR